MRKLIESTFVTLGGDISAPQEWGAGFLSGAGVDAHLRSLLFGAGALLLGRKTYEGLSAGYLAMAAGDPESVPDFVATMNAIPKHVASTTLTDLGWNASLLGPDVAAGVAALKQQPGRYLLKYGTGPLDLTLAAHGLIDEFQIWVVPVTAPPGQRLFEDVPDLRLKLTGSTAFETGVVLLTYVPDGAA